MDTAFVNPSHIHASAMILRIITVSAILCLLNTTEEGRKSYRPYINAVVAIVAVTWFLAVFYAIAAGSAVLTF